MAHRECVVCHGLSQFVYPTDFLPWYQSRFPLQGSMSRSEMYHVTPQSLFTVHSHSLQQKGCDGVHCLTIFHPILYIEYIVIWLLFGIESEWEWEMDIWYIYNLYLHFVSTQPVHPSPGFNSIFADRLNTSLCMVATLLYIVYFIAKMSSMFWIFTLFYVPTSCPTNFVWYRLCCHCTTVYLFSCEIMCNSCALLQCYNTQLM